MKNSSIYHTIGIVFIVFILLGGSSCKQNSNGDLPVLDLGNAMNNGLIEIDDKYHNYSQAYCNFLKNSSSLAPEDIRNVYWCENDLYVLFPDLFLQFNIQTGNLLFTYKSSDKVNFVDFTYDLATQRAYILDDKNSQVLELSTKGDLIKTIKLDSNHSYTLIKHLEDRTFLVPIQTIPNPSFLVVDFKHDEVKNYDFVPAKKAQDIPIDSDSVWIKYPLYVADETPEGVRVKYLFNDHVFLCAKDEVKIDYTLNMGKQKLKRRYPWTNTKFKNNDRFRIIKFWHTGKKIYVISQSIVKNSRGIFDYKVLSQFKDFKSIDSFSGYIAVIKLASLNPYKEAIFMDNERRRFISFRKISDKEKEAKDKWPEYMLEAENKEDLVISVFTMK